MRTTDIQEVRSQPLAELMHQARQVKLAHRGKAFSLCSIINAKSGKCSEDCKFCVQSGHYKTDTPTYPLQEKEVILDAAREAKRIGAHRFSIVTSGRGMKTPEVAKIAELVAEIKSQVQINVCASLGILSYENLLLLKEAGLSRYHHNLETSKEFFPQVVSTHTFEDRIVTIQACRKAGLEVCAGGIFGLGETEDDRISMALTLRELEVDSVPLNILIPLPGTPLENQPPLSAEEILRSIALYRLIIHKVPIRLAAGRETVLKDFLGMALMAGADGMMIGGYLTQRGRPPEDDHRLINDIKRLWTA